MSTILDSRQPTVLEALEGWVRLYQMVLTLKLALYALAIWFVFSPFVAMAIVGTEASQARELKVISTEAIRIVDSPSLSDEQKRDRLSRLDDKQEAYLASRTDDEIAYETRIGWFIVIPMIACLFLFLVSANKNKSLSGVYLLWCVYSSAFICYLAFTGSIHGTSIVSIRHGIIYYSSFVVHPVFFVVMMLGSVKAIFGLRSNKDVDDVRSLG